MYGGAPLPDEAPAISTFDLELRTEDGVTLRGTVREPEGPSGVRATLVLAHAAFARRSAWEKPRGKGLAERYATLGYRTISFDFRGHGESERGASASAYDAFVRWDLPSVVACARDRGQKVVVIGHSLGGHVALASQGIGKLGADALVVAGATVWHPAFEPSFVRSVALTGAAGVVDTISRYTGKFPARALGMGSDDADQGSLTPFLRAARGLGYGSDDGHDDYLAALSRVKVPVAGLVSRGDGICSPEQGARFVRRTSGPTKVIVLGRGPRGEAPPSHMELVTSEACHAAWDAALAWVIGEEGRRAGADR